MSACVAAISATDMTASSFTKAKLLILLVTKSSAYSTYSSTVCGGSGCLDGLERGSFRFRWIGSQI